MPVIEIRSIRRVSRGQGGAPSDRERLEVAGAINVTGRVGSYSAGSFQLRHIDSIVLGPSSAPAQRRNVYGSVRDPNTTYGNSVLLGGIISGSTGTRLAGIAAIGSKVGAGTVSNAYFIAHGY